MAPMGLGGLMDSFNTKLVLGATQFSEAVLGKKVGKQGRWYFGAIARLHSVLDIISRLFLPIYVTAIRKYIRGFSHSIFFRFLFAPVLGWVWVYKN